VDLVLVRFLTVLLVEGLFFVYTVIYDVYKQAQSGKRNKSFIVELESEVIKIWGSE